MAFDIEGARKAGYSDAEIASYLAQRTGEPAAPVDDGIDVASLGRMAQLLNPVSQLALLATPEGRKTLANHLAGGVRGAGSIGSTIMAIGENAASAAQGNGLSLEDDRKRRRDMDATLRDFGADTNSGAFQVGKVGTEVAGTLPLGGIAGKAVGTVAPRLGQAITSGGFTTGEKVARGIVPAVKDAAIRTAGGVINGALTAGAVNPDDAPTGAVIGGLLPNGAKLAGAVGRAVGSAFSRNAARNAVVDKIAGDLGDQAPQVVADINTYYPKGAENIPVSAAAATKNPVLAQAEQGSRIRSAPEWHAFDVDQANAAYGNVLEATKEAGEVGARAGARSDNWTEAWNKASANLKPRLWNQRMTQFGSDMDRAMVSPESSNPAVRSVLEAVNAEMDRLGPNFTPANLQQLRANLNGKVQPMSPDVFKSAPRDNPAIISLKQEMDDILNTVTGGKWQKVIEGYAKDSEALHAAKAAQKVRNAYTDAQTGRIVSPVISADIPKVTAANLNRAMDAARLPDKSLALSGEANQRLEATLDALRRQGITQEVKRSATAGGGSDTVSNAIASGIADQSPSLVAQAIAGLRKAAVGKRDAAAAQLLSNPSELAKELERWLRPPPVNPPASLFYRGAPAIAADQ